MLPNLLVSYDPKAGYMTGRNEIQSILTKLGDQKAQTELLIAGIIGITTSLKNRDVIEEVKDMFAGNPESINATLKWVPVDFWCDANLDSLKQVIREEIRDTMSSEDQYAIDVVKHRSELHSKDIIEAVAPLLRGKVNLDHPQKIIRIELFDKKATITLLTPKDIFSVMLSV